MSRVLDLLTRAADARHKLEQARIDYDKAKGLCALEQEVVEAELKKIREGGEPEASSLQPQALLT